MENKILQQIIKIGEDGKYSEIDGFPDRPDKAYNIIPKDTVRVLGIDELVWLIKGFSIVEHTKFGEFGIGSPTPIRWMFDILRKKVERNKSEENITILRDTADWMNRTTNYYKYNGSINN